MILNHLNPPVKVSFGLKERLFRFRSLDGVFVVGLVYSMDNVLWLLIGKCSGFLAVFGCGANQHRHRYAGIKRTPRCGGRQYQSNDSTKDGVWDACKAVPQ